MKEQASTEINNNLKQQKSFKIRWEVHNNDKKERNVLNTKLKLLHEWYAFNMIIVL